MQDGPATNCLQVAWMSIQFQYGTHRTYHDVDNLDSLDDRDSISVDMIYVLQDLCRADPTQETRAMQ